MKATLALASLATRLGLAAGGAGRALSEGRTDVATPFTALDGIAEGAALRQLGLSPYAGSFLHAPPLLNAVLGVVVGRHPVVELLPFVAADALSAVLLYRLAQAYTLRQLSLRQSVRSSKVAPEEHGEPTSPWACALLFLWSPCAIAACVGRCWTALETTAVLTALTAALERRVAFAALALVCATYMSLYPVILAVPVLLLLAEGAPWRAASLRLACWSVLWACSLAVGSVACGRQHGSPVQEWLGSTYGALLRVDDLAPNMGLWWYFFTEIFDHFRTFFIFIFHLQSALLLVPLTIRLRQKPLVLAVIACMLIALFKSYTSVGDLALGAALLPIVRHELLRVRVTFVVICALALAAVLNPLLWRLWVQLYTGNANFVLATTIVHSLALTAGVVNIVSGACA